MCPQTVGHTINPSSRVQNVCSGHQQELADIVKIPHNVDVLGISTEGGMEHMFTGHAHCPGKDMAPFAAHADTHRLLQD